MQCYEGKDKVEDRESVFVCFCMTMCEWMRQQKGECG